MLDWSPRFNFGNPRPLSAINHICIHVTVNSPGTPAENVAQYQIDSESGSYHMLVDTRLVVLKENTDDWQTWSAGPTSNRSGLHLSFVMRGTETREQWLAQDRMLRAGAQVCAEWARRYRIPVVKRSAGELRAGRGGFCGHVDTAQAWGETDHVDPGPGFPWDRFLAMVAEAQHPTPPKGDDDMTPEDRALLTETRDLCRFILAQLGGEKAPGQFGGWPQGGNRTMYDLLAATAARAGVPGTTDLKK
ncbi:N-acetylmuramoyl-L-alanine amidase [Corynebacterium heidelbergense]|uniref:N-acetylmuramoyl-L-alanine amidase n=1 Tax=Corynebacterium heidelbergense TaxID=2055947 RepID=A0A364VA99_9CORY|nr:N-acetylmuramoyl-L-alanine amidase [Corynebacterium heidelbergense]RAV33538.1 N-acetylmuramoyl-L-alanine amidase [Corynebacterium heidelbergense]WCZ36174.1 N-acetylmuramoyl-L-alanine amidase [Corynebacterium heidelbergense]WCZ37629.1 N-acetylmuramoyl-L-alanine amidase [Corynebacterium heidelbergense]